MIAYPVAQKRSMARETLLFWRLLRDNLPFGHYEDHCDMKARLSNLGAIPLIGRGKAVRVSACLILALFFALCLPHFAAAANSAGNSISRGLPFAVADFDGDHQPDLASVQTGALGTSSGNYLVRFRLSTLGRRYIRVTAPKGGLLVEARDVNGDQLPDLVFASAWLDKPVAILLNDGNGNFSQVDPANYPDASRTSSSGWNTSLNHYSLAFGLPQKSSAGEISLADYAEELNTNHECLKTRGIRLASAQALTPRAPRAPPLAILL